MKFIKITLYVIMVISLLVALKSLAIDANTVFQQIYISMTTMSCSVIFVICLASIYIGRDK